MFTTQRFLCSRTDRARLNRQPANPLANRRFQDGFTLVEMLIASLVFTVAVVALMSMVLLALAARFYSRIESAALKLSQQKIEELKSHPLNDALLSISGNVLNGSGEIDFDAGPDPQATSTSELILNRTRGTTLFFETRWNIAAAGAKKVITVATRKTGGSPNHSKPINLKVVLAP
jgi:prepilin-type N-terminal cleavage/methylation domain-containing protein